METKFSQVENGPLAPGALREEPTGRNGLAQRWADPKVRRLILGSVGAVVIVAASLFYYYHYRITTDDAQVDGHLVPIAPKVSGNVAEVLVTDNQAVKAGQVLVRIDPRDYQVRVDQARAALALAESQAQAAHIGVPLTAETTQSGLAGAQAQLAAAQADHERAKVAYDTAATADVSQQKANVAVKKAMNDRAQTDLARMKPLLAKQEISQQQYDAYFAAAQASENEWVAAKEKLTATERAVDVAKASLSASQARLEQAQAALQQAQAARKQVTIRSAEASSAVAAVS